jgi:hypothetical protein
MARGECRGCKDKKRGEAVFIYEVFLLRPYLPSLSRSEVDVSDLGVLWGFCGSQVESSLMENILAIYQLRIS